jgi:general secretion pathway protein K
MTSYPYSAQRTLQHGDQHSRQLSRQHSHQTRGVVLLSVLLIMALLASLAYQLVGRHSLVVAQARQTYGGDQALSYALGGEALARQMLFEDWSETGRDIDTLLEPWAQPLQPFEIEEGFLEVQIRDLNRCFNLNSIASGNAKANLARFKTLLRNHNIPDNIGDLWLDWIDADQQISGFGAEDGDYLLASRAYRAANAPAGHITELNLLKDIEPDYVRVLKLLTCTLPEEDLKLNVNTATAAALASLSPSLTESQMLSFTESERSYENVSEVTSEYPDLTTAVDVLSVTSEYFEVQVRAEVDGNLTELASVLYRNPSDGSMKLLSRDFGRTFKSLFVEDADVLRGDVLSSAVTADRSTSSGGG